MAPSDRSPNKKPNPYNNYLKYSGLALQLLITIGVSGWVGYKIDEWLNLQYPVFMVILGMAGFGGSMYQLYRSVNRQ
jgi:hypothetical protein